MKIQFIDNRRIKNNLFDYFYRNRIINKNDNKKFKRFNQISNFANYLN